jgi:hypothetical protein
MNAPLAEIELITKIAQNITTTGLLLFAVWAFYNGNIVSRATMEKIIAGIVAQITEKLDARFDEFGKKLDNIKGRGW